MLVKGLPHHDQSRWTCTSDHVEEKVSISIITKMDQIRAEHVAFISLLARYNNEVWLSVCLSVCCLYSVQGQAQDNRVFGANVPLPLQSKETYLDSC